MERFNIQPFDGLLNVVRVIRIPNRAALTYVPTLCLALDLQISDNREVGDPDLCDELG